MKTFSRTSYVFCHQSYNRSSTIALSISGSLGEFRPIEKCRHAEESCYSSSGYMAISGKQQVIRNFQGHSQETASASTVWDGTADATSNP